MLRSQHFSLIFASHGSICIPPPPNIIRDKRMGMSNQENSKTPVFDTKLLYEFVYPALKSLMVTNSLLCLRLMRSLPSFAKKSENSLFSGQNFIKKCLFDFILGMTNTFSFNSK